jgi:hypothetical protein
MLIAKLAVPRPHSFAAVQQAVYLNELQFGLQVGVMIIQKIIPSYYKTRRRDSTGIMPMRFWFICFCVCTLFNDTFSVT